MSRPVLRLPPQFFVSLSLSLNWRDGDDVRPICAEKGFACSLNVLSHVVAICFVLRCNSYVAFKPAAQQTKPSSTNNKHVYTTFRIYVCDCCGVGNKLRDSCKETRFYFHTQLLVCGFVFILKFGFEKTRTNKTQTLAHTY